MNLKDEVTEMLMGWLPETYNEQAELIINKVLDAAIESIEKIKVSEDTDMTYTEKKYFNFGVDGSCDVIEALKVKT